MFPKKSQGAYKLFGKLYFLLSNKAKIDKISLNSGIK